MDPINTGEIFSRNVIIPILYVILSSLALFSIIQIYRKSDKAKNARPVIFIRLCGMVKKIVFVKLSKLSKLSMVSR